MVGGVSGVADGGGGGGGGGIANGGGSGWDEGDPSTNHSEVGKVLLPQMALALLHQKNDKICHFTKVILKY